MTGLSALVVSAAAAAAGFSFHVVASEKASHWITKEMQGRSLRTSRNVIFPAAITSLEMGVGLAIFYALVRDHLPFGNPFLRGVTVGLLVLVMTGKLFRQPIMNWIIGNPMKVVLVQDGVTWLSWLLTTTVLAVVYEGLV